MTELAAFRRKEERGIPFHNRLFVIPRPRFVHRLAKYAPACWDSSGLLQKVDHGEMINEPTCSLCEEKRSPIPQILQYNIVPREFTSFKFWIRFIHHRRLESKVDDSNDKFWDTDSEYDEEDESTGKCEHGRLALLCLIPDFEITSVDILHT
ncbi:hypothetical protein N431DRAFT_442963 [Stipitochalara longipes BDJ]|nr:hypothetical protein N431DRAFT_442963 [Stipitochalara longipes BDJ]